MVLVSWGSFANYAAKQGKEHKGNHRDMERRPIPFDINLLILLWGHGKKANYFERLVVSLKEVVVNNETCKELRHE